MVVLLAMNVAGVFLLDSNASVADDNYICCSDGVLYVAECVKGLLAVDTNTKQVTTVANFVGQRNVTYADVSGWSVILAWHCRWS